MSLCQPVIWSMAAMLRDSTVIVIAIVRTRPRAIPLAMITMRKSTHGFPFVSHIGVAYEAPLGGSPGRRSSAINHPSVRGNRWIVQVYYLVRRTTFILRKLLLQTL